MPEIILETQINAPAKTCFDLMCDKVYNYVNRERRRGMDAKKPMPLKLHSVAFADQRGL